MTTAAYILLFGFSAITLYAWAVAELYTKPWQHKNFEKHGIANPRCYVFNDDARRKEWGKKYCEMIDILDRGETVPEDDELMKAIYEMHKVNGRN